MGALRLSAIVGYAGLLMASRLGGAGLNFVTQVLLARLLGAEQFGIYVIAFSLAGILSVIFSLGFPSITSRFVSEYRASERWDLLAGFVSRGRLSIAVSAAVLIPLLVAAILLGFDVDVIYRMPLLIGCAAAPFLSVIRFHGALANAFRHFVLSYLPDLIVRPALFMAAIAAVYWLRQEATTSLVLALHLAIIVLLAAGQAIALRQAALHPAKQVKLQFDARAWHSAGWPLLIVVLFTTFFADVDIALLGLLLPPQEVAIFSVCIKVTLLIAFGIQAIDQLCLPDLSDAYIRGDETAVNQAIVRANHLKLWPALLAAAAIVVAGDRILAIFGPEFQAGHAALIILVGSQVVRAAVGPITPLLSLSGEQRRSVPIFAVALALLVGLNLTLVPAFGIYGAAFAFSAVTIAWTVLIAWFLTRRMGYRSWIVAC